MCFSDKIPDFRKLKSNHILASVRLEVGSFGSGVHSDTELMSGSVDSSG